ncbi:MAG: hypothetical protein LKM45_05950, partial [Wolbachia endosymbiont of Alcedoecus sp.]|nr:hypothetical protein [Wolbachia endosymbiont of Alcedoecus sp.]
IVFQLKSNKYLSYIMNIMYSILVKQRFEQISILRYRDINFLCNMNLQNDYFSLVIAIPLAINNFFS